MNHLRLSVHEISKEHNQIQWTVYEEQTKKNVKTQLLKWNVEKYKQ